MIKSLSLRTDEWTDSRIAIWQLVSHCV